MKRNSNRMFVPFAAAALALLVLFTSACSLGSYSQVIEINLSSQMLTQGQPSFTVSGQHTTQERHGLRSIFDCVEVNEHLGWNIQGCLEEINQRGSHNFWEEFEGVDIQRMELHDGFVRLLGTCSGRESGPLACSFDVRLSAVDGRLVSEIIDVDVPGLSLQDARILSINQDMQVQLYMEGIDAGAEVYFEDVTISEAGIDLTLKVTLGL